MKKILSIVLAFISITSFACTSAIITGKATPDGRALMWKHRDTGTLDNRIEKIEGEKYSFIALFNSNVDEATEAWAGTNETGFSIMNTASYNLKPNDDKTKIVDLEGVIMYKALSVCKNLEDFENLLNKMKKPLGVEANFGVIDAEGGAAYYEVNNFEWTKIDVNDPKIAPQGFLVVANYEYTGDYDQGSGYVRYTTAHINFLKNKGRNGEFTPQWIFNDCSRSFYNSALDIDLVKDPSLTPSGWFIDQDFIARRISSASVVIQSVLPEENPALTTMWTVLGYPPIGVVVPLFVNEQLPKYMVKYSDNNYQTLLIDVENPLHCEMCDYVLELKKDVFPMKRGNGKDYFNFSKLYNSEGNGYMQVFGEVEKSIFEVYDIISKKWRESGKVDSIELQSFYDAIYLNIANQKILRK